MSEINTHGMICDFGKHAGERYTRLPVSYLRWMVRSDHTHKEIARAELARRGTVVPDMDVSGHAIDRASLHCLQIWRKTRRDSAEGLHAWLVRMAEEAYKNLERCGKPHQAKIRYTGMTFVFQRDCCLPTLKTVYRDTSQR